MTGFAINERAVLAFFHDVFMLALSWLLTSALFAHAGAPPHDTEYLNGLGMVLAVAIPVQASVSVIFGMYQGLWRYASLPDVQRIVASSVAGSIAVALTLWTGNWLGGLDFPRFFVQTLLLVVLMSGSRIGYRSWKEWRLYGNAGEHGTPVVVLGAGDAAVSLIKELSRSAEWRVVGLLDDDPNKRHRLLHGFRVLGAIEELPRLSRALKVKHAIIAMPSVTYTVRRRVVQVCNRARVSVMTVPKFNGIAISPDMGSKAQQPKIRRVAVEDLMKREPILLDDAGLHDLLTDKVVMVTGAGGSIGSELCVQIA